MRKFLAGLLLFCVTLGILVSNVEAGRFGGGRSFGMTRSVSSFSSKASNFSRSPLASAPRALNFNRWVAPLIGLAAGGLLASLFMSNGIGSGILSWIMLAGVVFLLMRLFRGRTSNMQPIQQQFATYDSQASASRQTHANFHPSFSAPVGFDENNFLREAKVIFLRLQAASDNKNLTDLRQFTTPPVFAEIQMQLQERGDQPSVTEVDFLNAELLNVSTEQDGMVATVNFTGRIKEEGRSSELNEYWHFIQDGLTWRVAGVQQ